MSQFLSMPNAQYSREGAGYRADANGILSVPDSLDPVFRNIYGLPTWIPDPVKGAQPVAASADHEDKHEA